MFEAHSKMYTKIITVTVFKHYLAIQVFGQEDHIVYFVWF